MPKKSAVKTRTIRTTEIEEPSVVETPETTFQAMVREALDTDFFPDELAHYTYKISVQRFSQENGRFVTIKGRTFDNLQEIGDHLGGMYGSGRFRLFVQGYPDENQEGKPEFVRIENYCIEYAGPAGEGNAERENDEAHMNGALALQIEKMKQDRELIMELLKQNAQIMVAAMNQKSGGGVGAGSILQAVKLGTQLAGGTITGDGEDPGGEDGGMNLKGIVNSPLGQALAVKLLEALTPKPPAAPSPAPVPAGSEAPGV